MSRLAMDQITITDITDGENGVSVKIVTPFYALGTAAPDKPTTNPPSSIWTTTEPEYAKGKNLYTTQRTVLEDSTFWYSDVSLDSSYKASEKAITTADTANTTAGEAKTTADEAKTASTTNKNNLDAEIQARNDAISNLKTSIDADIAVVRQKSDDAQQAADDASADLSAFRTSTENQLTSVNGLVSGLRTDVDAVTDKANTLSSGLDTANTKITQTSDKVDGLTTTVSNVSTTADSALSLSTQNHQDLTSFQTTVSNTYSTKPDTLSQVSAVSQKADDISATLSTDYDKKTVADSKYASKTELQATSNSITASVSETYATKSVVQALQNIADNAIETWQGHGEPSLTVKPAVDWNTPELKKQHSGDMYYDLDTGYSYRFVSDDGSTYAWGKISDSDITKAMQAAAAAQSSADTANAGVSKLNTDIPATYATKSDVKITTDGIKTDVIEAKTLGQTGIDNAATVDQKADGIQATVTQQAQTISDNVKAIAQVNMRADSLATSIAQVSTKTDQALANAQELVVNGGFESDGISPWYVNATYQVVNDMASAHSGRYYLNAGSATEISQIISIPVIPGHIYRFSGWYRRPSTNSSIIGGIRFQKSSDGTTYTDWLTTDFGNSKQDDWTYFSIDGTIPFDGSAKYVRYRLAFANTTGVVQHFDDLSFKDITEAQAAKKAADDAQSTANTALSQNSTLAQDLNGFKTTVSQTYDTKQSALDRESVLTQNINGFKTTVSETYTTISDFNNLQISGGRNIARDTKNFGNMNVGSSDSGYLRGCIGRTNGTYNGCVVQSITSDDTSYITLFEYGVKNVAPGEYYTMSFWAKGSGTMRLYCYGPAGGYIGAKRIASSDSQAAATGYDDGKTNMALSSDWKRYWVTWKLNDNPPTGYSTDKYFLLRNDNKMTSCDVSGVMIEKGNKASEWAPAPEDIEMTYATQSLVRQTAQEWAVQLNQVSTATDNAIADVKDTLGNQSDALTATSDKIDDEITQRQAYMNFTQDKNGNPLLELGASQNTNKVDITNEKVSFKSEGSEVAYISNKELHINNATIVQKLIIGNQIGFIPRADGHLTLTRI